MDRPSQEERFAFVKAALSDSCNAELLDRPVSYWVLGSDRHLPQSFLSWPIRDVLSLSFDQLTRKQGVGERRIGKLIDVLERVGISKSVSYKPLNLFENTVLDEPFFSTVEKPESGEITEELWQTWCTAIRRFQLDNENLGRFAGTLNDLPQTLWFIPLKEYSGRHLYELQNLAGHGPGRIGQVIDIFSRVAQVISYCPIESPLSIRLLHPNVLDMLLWTEHVLRKQNLVSVEEIQDGFLRPLLNLLEIDLGSDTSTIIRRRVGIDGCGETLEQIANDIGLTRERVRQIVMKAVKVTEARWPDGAYILNEVFAKLQRSYGCDEQLKLMHNVLDSCFAIEVSRSSSRADVLAAWERAGRSKLTPMNQTDVRSWAAKEFPDQSAEVVGRWLDEEGLKHTSENGDILFFSKDPLDYLLLHLHKYPDPVSISELSDFVVGEERSIRSRLERDPRFIEDEFKRVVLAEQCSFFRRDGRWMVRLEPIQGDLLERRAESIGVAELVQLTVGGLIQNNICDATVWGVHRFLNTQLKIVFGATLAPSVTPFILASTLVRHSEGLMRHMRRRRLRWDSADGSIPVRGKQGWIDYVVSSVGIPITMEELDIELRKHYQDYESYVLKQLYLTEDEEGETSCGIQFVPGVSHVVPTLVIPRDWKLELPNLNISEDVRLAVTKIIAMSTRAPFPKHYLRRVPWMIQLCDHLAYGAMRWEERLVEIERNVLEEEVSATSESIIQNQNNTPSTQSTESALVEDLLSKFF